MNSYINFRNLYKWYGAKEHLNREEENRPYVVINITNHCNLRCLHCFNGSSKEDKKPKELLDDEILKIVDELILMKVANVCFSGGEPFLRKKLLIKCLSRLNKNGIRTSIVTNGTLIDRETADLLKLSGVSEIEISLDGVKSTTHEKLRGVQGCFQKAVDSIMYLTSAGILTSISYTLNKWNVDEMYGVIEKFKNVNVSAIYFRPLLVMGTAVLNSKRLMPTMRQYRRAAKTIQKCREQCIDFEVGLSDPINHIYYYRQNVISITIEIQANGDIYCSYCIPKKIGNVQENTLSYYWKNGLKDIWLDKEINYISRNIYSFSDLSRMISEIN